MENLEQFSLRKKDHIRLSLDKRTQGLTVNSFDSIGLIHEALPDFNFSEVSLETNLLSQSVSTPHFVSSMTAGHEDGQKINHVLAEACSIQGWMMAVGSQKKELLDPIARNEWKEIRNLYSNTHFLSNIGIEEVVRYPVKDILKLTDVLQSIGIIVHLNSLQEVFQNKDDVYFKGSLAKLKSLVTESPVPVLIKEVGFGFSSETIKKLLDLGVNVVDVSGNGGTHWVMLESLRSTGQEDLSRVAENFSDWGYSTVQSLKNAKEYNNGENIWASGGIRNGVDSAKCLALGAAAVGTAQPLLKSCFETKLKNPVEAVLKTMNQFDLELKISMFGMGLKSISDFSKKQVWYGK